MSRAGTRAHPSGLAPRSGAALVFASAAVVCLAWPLLSTIFSGDGVDSLTRSLGGGAVVVRNTAVVASAAALIGTLLAWSAAHVYQHYDVAGRRLTHALCLAPLLLPPPTIALALLTLAGHNGVITRQLGNASVVYGPVGLIVSITLSTLPFAYVVLLHGISRQDRRVAEAAADLGAGPARIAARELSALRPSLGVAALVLFAEAATDLADPLVLGGGYTVVATRLFEAATAENDLTDAAVHGALLAGAGLLVAVSVSRLGGTARPALRREPRHLRKPEGAWAHGAVMLSRLVATAVAVAFVVITASAFDLWSGSGPSLDAVWAVVAGPHQVALADTVFAGMVAALLTVPLALWLGIALAFTRSCLLAPLVAALQAVPALVYGLAAWIALTRTATSLGPSAPAAGTHGEAQTWALLLGVLLLASLPGTALTLADALRRLPLSHVESALSLGAGPTTILREVWWPALRPLLADEFCAALARSLAALAPAALLATTRTPLLPVDLVSAAEAGRVGQACAMALVLGGIVAAMTVLTHVGPTHMTRS